MCLCCVLVNCVGGGVGVLTEVLVCLLRVGVGVCCVFANRVGVGVGVFVVFVGVFLRCVGVFIVC